MKKMRLYKREPGAILLSYDVLSLEEKGAAHTILDLIYESGKPCPADPRFLAHKFSRDCSPKKASRILASLVAKGKFVVNGDFIYQIRAMQELKKKKRMDDFEYVKNRKILLKNTNKCSYCGTDKGPFDVDHVIPVSYGGTNDIGNLTLACRRCNRSKGAKLVNEWLRSTANG